MGTYAKPIQSIRERKFEYIIEQKTDFSCGAASLASLLKFAYDRHDINEQIATYKAAKRVVSLDSSALHMAAMLVSADTKVAIINRGPSNNIQDYIAQFTRWQGHAPTKVEAVSGYYFPEGQRMKKRETHATLDFPAVGAALVAGGFLPDGTTWDAPSPDMLSSAVETIATRLEQPLTHHAVEG